VSLPTGSIPPNFIHKGIHTVEKIVGIPGVIIAKNTDLVRIEAEFLTYGPSPA